MKPTGIQKRPTSASGTPERINQAALYTPLVDIIETNDAFIFQADLPGVKPGDIDISFDNGVLSIEGRVQPRQKPDQQYIWQEYGVGNFHRQFTLNTPINVERIHAELKNGELTLTVPKAEQARTRRIQVKGG
jgi:HSP20 family molecular chaperone IbpA